MNEDRHRLLDIILKAVGGLAVLTTFVWTIYQYEDTNQRSFYSTYWNKKIETYSSLCRWAAATAVHGGGDQQRNEFWEAYYSLIVRDDPEVLKSAKKFADLIEGWQVGPPIQDPNKFPYTKSEKAAEELSQVCGSAIRDSWNRHFQSKFGSQ